MRKEELSSHEFSYNYLLKKYKRLKKTNYILIGYAILTILIMLYNMLIHS
jgi:hypothetical protein